jgi:hypothetical protein
MLKIKQKTNKFLATVISDALLASAITVLPVSGKVNSIISTEAAFKRMNV